MQTALYIKICYAELQHHYKIIVSGKIIVTKEQ